MRRFVIPVVVLLAAGCGVGGRSPEDQATEQARKLADRAGNRIYDSRTRPAQDVAHRAADLDGVEVMRVTGASTAGDGIRLVLRTSGTAPDGGWFATSTVTVRRCFELRFSTTTEWEHYGTREVTCPAGGPLAFKPWPKAPRIPFERLRKALPRVPEGGRADEAKVRAAVGSLRLDPAVRREFQTAGGRVGVALTVKPYWADTADCVLAIVEPGHTNVWTPPRVQRMPGEGGCSTANALNPLPPPH
ncbi:translation initiation factor IF-2 [Actinomadura sp. WMMA1423]|uniref:translation initiation factor IF-2 n=1 Tax=Actinomadura sp. WMMA1423 TaxID=2591108 RepID=UPI0011469E6B|nr:translation initiation factor IF-2 [Actinomadura sp. WMMA1423]